MGCRSARPLWGLSTVGGFRCLAALKMPVEKDLLVGAITHSGNAVSSAVLHITRCVILFSSVIQSFRDDDTYQLFIERDNRQWRNIKSIALRKLDQMEAATNLNDLRVPPGNRLEPLTGNRNGQHSIRINDQFRICFVWKEDGAHNVEIVDYHPESRRRKKHGPQSVR